MRRLEVCEALGEEHFGEEFRDRHLSNKFLLGFSFALDDGLVLIFL